ncbi:hypothetical protein [Polyangium sp. 15x6]|uniref:hypothetical protein n=1 Tax=Polyangium sp. 15x6 TaxID=3042687 RepID=UPI00249A642F|nr:hypothetical protein [Polyangium sp. 15x6]MDI3284494.1 hypothetical protein [Polyangium sp. 15x6]
MRTFLLLFMVTAVSLAACGDDKTGGDGGAGPGGSGGSGGSGGGSDGGGGTGGQGGGSSTGGGSAAGGSGGGSACAIPAGVEYNDMGCLTYTGAAALCGFPSDGTACELAVSCMASTDEGQCNINCEMGTTIKCYKEADVQCLVSAVCAGDCDALKACGFVL